MSDTTTTNTVEGDDTVPATAQGWSMPAVFVGLALIAIAVSGLLNEMPATEHPLWIVPAVAAFAACLAVVVSTLRGLASSPS